MPFSEKMIRKNRVSPSDQKLHLHSSIALQAMLVREAKESNYDS